MLNGGMNNGGPATRSTNWHHVTALWLPLGPANALGPDLPAVAMFRSPKHDALLFYEGCFIHRATTEHLLDVPAKLWVLRISCFPVSVKAISLRNMQKSCKFPPVSKCTHDTEQGGAETEWE